MSALTPHIRVLRAEAEALKAQAEYRHEQSSAIRSVEGLTVACLLLDLATAKTQAADKLEAEEREREGEEARGSTFLVDGQAIPQPTRRIHGKLTVRW